MTFFLTEFAYDLVDNVLTCPTTPCTVTMSAAWRGGLEGADNYTGDPALEAAISSAMNYWFKNDFTEPACLDNWGTADSSCPCGTPGLWNTNWYSNVCTIKTLFTTSLTCLLLCLRSS